MGLFLTPMHGLGEPSAWVRRWSHLVAPGAKVLDVACGAGRHSRWFAQRGAEVTALDRDAQALAQVGPGITTVLADIEQGPWPFGPEQFDALVVTNYLWRPLWPTWVASLKPGGVVVAETFALGQARWGKPSNPEFLLQPGELWSLVQPLHVLAFEDGLLDSPPRRVQRVVAVRPPQPGPELQGDRPLSPPK